MSVRTRETQLVNIAQIVGSEQLAHARGITSADLVEFLSIAADVIRDSSADLDRLDAALGDGDHGENMVSGLQSVLEVLQDPPDDIGELLRTVGHTLVVSVGGASGPLYGTAFIEAGILLHGLESVDLPALALAFDAAAAGLARRGRCMAGDKTIYDALEPAARAVRKAADKGWSLPVAIAAAAQAAHHGMVDTIPLVARRGLALRLGERSRGHQDPGATSCYLLLRAALAAAHQQSAHMMGSAA